MASSGKFFLNETLSSLPKIVIPVETGIHKETKNTALSPQRIQRKHIKGRQSNVLLYLPESIPVFPRPVFLAFPPRPLRPLR
jgi:hypothetical protein